MTLIYIISIINLIAIVIIFILMFRRNKESFTGAPTGYNNLLVSDTEGNLNTFSMDKLKTDIDTIISSKISPLNTLLKTHETWIDSNTTKIAENTNMINAIHDQEIPALQTSVQEIPALKTSVQKCIKGDQKIYINTLNGDPGQYGFGRLFVGRRKNDHVLRTSDGRLTQLSGDDGYFSITPA